MRGRCFTYGCLLLGYPSGISTGIYSSSSRPLLHSKSCSFEVFRELGCPPHALVYRLAVAAPHEWVSLVVAPPEEVSQVDALLKEISLAHAPPE